MVEGGAGPEFPIVFFDGEREINIGNIRVYPMLEFKAFQLMLSQRIGISPNQISIYLCDRKSSKFEDRRRIPVTGKANFGLIAREKDCFFLVVLKRSRKSRSRKAKVDINGFVTENEFPAASTPPENLILLRRNQLDMNMQFGSAFYDQIEQLQNLRMQRDNYAMAMAQSIPNLNSPFSNPNSFPRIQDTLPVQKKKYACEECKNGRTFNFHHCVNDPVVVDWIRSPFGPVRRSVNLPL